MKLEPVDIMNMMQQSMDEFSAQLAQQREQIAAMLDEHTQLLQSLATAPKRVIRDEQGRVAGAETVTQ